MSLKKSLLLLAVVVLPLGILNAATTYQVDPKASKVKWLGKKVTGEHDGAIQIKEGTLVATGKFVTGGKFLIDTTSITVEDLKDEEANGNLVGHLKSPDFFSAEKHPTAAFEVTKVEPLTNGKDGATHTVTGNLTIKDITKPLSFPAKITVTPTTVTADAKNVAVDRTLYEIKYGSGKFFQGLGDKVISDQFWLDIALVAKK